MIARACRRDVAWVGSEAAVVERYRRFRLPIHELYERLTQAPARAHAVIDNRILAQPKFLRLDGREHLGS